jgi:hypothetical protein
MHFTPDGNLPATDELDVASGNGVGSLVRPVAQTTPHDLMESPNGQAQYRSD